MNRDNDKGKVLIRRSLIMALGKFFLLLVIVGRLYYLQVYQADRYKTLADENRISTRLLIPPRGVIYDRNGVMIATNTQNFQALIVAEQTPNVQETLDAFKKIMPLSADEEEKIKRDMKRNRSFANLVMILKTKNWSLIRLKPNRCIAFLRLICNVARWQNLRNLLKLKASNIKAG